ncbi:MAG: signal peptidase I [Clostridia bacterium]|nr:signal peptidase I [Clostridia bacterium]
MDEEKTKKSGALAGIYSVVEIIAVAVVVVILLFTFVARLSTVSGTSMVSTLSNGDKLVISNLFYTPKTGDIIVFQQSGGYFNEPLIKRVIAVGGQRLRIDFTNWLVYVDGVALDETDYVNRRASTMTYRTEYYEYYADLLDESGTMTIPEGKIFVMGDNRNGSADSRFPGVGLVDVEDVMGKVLFRLFPIGAFGAVK